jgi:GT2 family glycosyltransferase
VSSAATPEAGTAFPDDRSQLQAAVTIVLPNYNGRELLRRFLPSVTTAAQGVAPPAEVVVADDASTDDSVAWLRAQWPQIAVIANEHNVGFGETANRGIKAARSPLVFLLNTDAEPDGSVLAPLVESMNERPEAAAIVPRILQMSAGGTCESVVFGDWRRGLLRVERRPDLCDAGQGQECRCSMPVLYPCGAAVMLRRDVFLQLGGFDPLFAPFYWEDADLGYRMWRAGYQVLYEPRARVLHYHPGAIETAHSERRAAFMQDRNRFLFTWKNIDGWLLIQHFAWLPAHVIISSLTGRGRFVAALASALRALPAALRRRGARGAGVLSSRQIFEKARLDEGPQHAGP